MRKSPADEGEYQISEITPDALIFDIAEIDRCARWLGFVSNHYANNPPKAGANGPFCDGYELYYYSPPTAISTRRFMARPSDVALSAIGLACP